MSRCVLCVHTHVQAGGDRQGQVGAGWRREKTYNPPPCLATRKFLANNMLKNTNFCVCAHGYLCVHMGVCSYMYMLGKYAFICVCVLVDTKGQLWVLFYGTVQIVFLRQNLPASDWLETCQVFQAHSRAQGPSSVHFPGIRTQVSMPALLLSV